MTRDPVYSAELAHDSAGVNVEKYMDAALDDVIYDLMMAGKVRGLSWGLQDFLAEQADLAELTAAALISGDFATFQDMIVSKLRVELADHDAVHDRAYELATEGEES